MAAVFTSTSPLATPNWKSATLVTSPPVVFPFKDESLKYNNAASLISMPFAFPVNVAISNCSVPVAPFTSKPTPALSE